MSSEQHSGTPIKRIAEQIAWMLELNNVDQIDKIQTWLVDNRMIYTNIPTEKLATMYFQRCVKPKSQ